MKEFVGNKFLLIEENGSVPVDTRPWYEARSLKEAGAGVFVICPILKSGNHKQKFRIIDGIHIYRYKGYISNGTRFGYFREYATAFIKTLYLIHKVLFRHFPIHVVHVANPPDIFWPMKFYLRLFGIRFIFDQHDLSPETYLSKYRTNGKEEGIIYKAQMFMERMSYKVADAIISTNESYRARAISVSPFYSSKTFIVRNGPDTRYFSARLPNPSLKKGRSFLGVFIGAMSVQDGVDYIIRAMDIIVNKKKFKDLIIYLIGRGDEVPRLKHMTHHLNLDDYIVFTGHIPNEQIPEILSTADVCLSPDPSNPLNDLSTMVKMMEYMAIGKPIVSFNLKESRYSAGEGALFIENNNVQAFAEGILKVINDPRLSRTMGEIGRKRIEKELSWQKQEIKLLNVYKYVLSKRSN